MGLNVLLLFLSYVLGVNAKRRGIYLPRSNENNFLMFNHSGIDWYYNEELDDTNNFSLLEHVSMRRTSTGIESLDLNLSSLNPIPFLGFEELDNSITQLKNLLTGKSFGYEIGCVVVEAY
jgi:hypothetical protein